MARCELTGKGPVVVNLVSHSNIKTKSRSLPNVQQKRLYSAALSSMVNLKVAASTIRDIEHCGGFDKFILRQDAGLLSNRALTIRQRIVRRLRGDGTESKKTIAKAKKTVVASHKSPAPTDTDGSVATSSKKTSAARSSSKKTSAKASDAGKESGSSRTKSATGTKKKK